MVNQQSMTEQVEAASRAGQPVFDMVRGSIDGLPGFIAKSTTVKQVLPIVNRVTTYVVETVRTDDGYYGFIEAFTSEGMVRLPLPTKVMEALYRQHKAMVKKSKSDRAKRAAETRAANGVVPFVKTEADDLDDEVDIDDGEE